MTYSRKILSSPLFFLITHFVFLFLHTFSLQAQVEKKISTILSDRVVIKLKKNAPVLFKTQIRNFSEDIRFEPISKLRHLTTGNDLENVYLSSKIPTNIVINVVSRLHQMPVIEYAEPLYRHRLYETPNDPLLTSQSYFELIKAKEAWDIAKGSNGDVVIGLIDGGTDIGHPDLKNNIWVNTDEIPQNDLDDDQNGFVDDVNGWNFANANPNPTGLNNTPGSANHGTITAGIVCAVTDNGVGMAGTSWNARLMALNAGHPQEDGIVEYGYEGILYAIENGADVINISWGRGGPPSFFEQDVIQLALANGVALVASAGNEGSSKINYPAAYKGGPGRDIHGCI